MARAKRRTQLLDALDGRDDPVGTPLGDLRIQRLGHRGQRLGEALAQHVRRADGIDEPRGGQADRRAEHDLQQASPQQRRRRRGLQGLQQREGQRDEQRPPAIARGSQPQAQEHAGEDQRRGPVAAHGDLAGEGHRHDGAGGGAEHPQHALVDHVLPAAVAAVDDEGRQHDPAPVRRKDEIADGEGGGERGGHLQRHARVRRRAHRAGRLRSRRLGLDGIRRRQPAQAATQGLREHHPRQRHERHGHRHEPRRQHAGVAPRQVRHDEDRHQRQRDERADAQRARPEAPQPDRQRHAGHEHRRAGPRRVPQQRADTHARERDQRQREQRLARAAALAGQVAARQRQRQHGAEDGRRSARFEPLRAGQRAQHRQQGQHGFAQRAHQEFGHGRTCSRNGRRPAPTPRFSPRTDTGLTGRSGTGSRSPICTGLALGVCTNLRRIRTGKRLQRHHNGLDPQREATAVCPNGDIP